MCQSDFGVLEALFEQGPLPVNTIGKEILLTSGSITIAIDRLENRGLVRRRWQEEDRRVCVVELTPTGEELIRKNFHTYMMKMERAASGLSYAERNTLLTLLHKLNLTAQGIVLDKEWKAKKESEPSPTAGKIITAPAKPTQTNVPLVEEEVGFAGFTGLD